MKLRGLLLLLPALVALYCCCWLEACMAEPAYQSSGWRPRGQSLHPCYLPAPEMRTTKQQREPTTTPRSREQTTPRNPNDNDDAQSTSAESNNQEQQSPALAVANSFAFNRPIYVYNAYPYRFPSTYLLRA